MTLVCEVDQLITAHRVIISGDSIIKSDPKKNKETFCSDSPNVTLVIEYNLTPAHKVITLSARVVKSEFNDKIKNHYSDSPCVNLVYEDDQTVPVHKVILSSASSFFTKVPQKNGHTYFKTCPMEKKTKFHTEGF